MSFSNSSTLPGISRLCSSLISAQTYQISFHQPGFGQTEELLLLSACVYLDGALNNQLYSASSFHFTQVHTVAVRDCAHVLRTQAFWQIQKTALHDYFIHVLSGSSTKKKRKKTVVFCTNSQPNMSC